MANPETERPSLRSPSYHELAKFYKGTALAKGSRRINAKPEIDLDGIAEQVNVLARQAERLKDASAEQKKMISILERRHKTLFVAQVIAGAAFAGSVFANLLFGSIAELKSIDVAAWGAFVCAIGGAVVALRKYV